MAPKLATSWAVRFAAGEPLAQVEVQNLQTTTQAASDAWGRPGKTQPLLLSATISFAQPFVTAAAEDRLTTETLHYGNLSKAMLAAAASHHQHSSSSPSSSPHTDDDESSHLGGLVQHIWAYLTGRSPSGAPYQLDDETARTTTTQTQPLLSQVLSTSTISYLAVTATLPKASLLGSAVSLTISAAFQAGTYATTLRLHEVRVPTLIGVNDNERLAKQVVVATVTLDRIDEETLGRLGDGLFLGTEKLVVRVSAQDNTYVTSSFRNCLQSEKEGDVFDVVHPQFMFMGGFDIRSSQIFVLKSFRPSPLPNNFFTSSASTSFFNFPLKSQEDPACL